jgi:hypothetical protein
MPANGFGEVGFENVERSPSPLIEAGSVIMVWPC